MIYSLRELREALRSIQHNRNCSCYGNGGPCPRCLVGYDAVDEALQTGIPGLPNLSGVKAVNSVIVEELITVGINARWGTSYGDCKANIRGRVAKSWTLYRFSDHWKAVGEDVESKECLSLSHLCIPEGVAGARTRTNTFLMSSLDALRAFIQWAEDRRKNKYDKMKSSHLDAIKSASLAYKIGDIEEAKYDALLNKILTDFEKQSNSGLRLW